MNTMAAIYKVIQEELELCAIRLQMRKGRGKELFLFESKVAKRFAR
jgi:hypothetical protein